MAKQTQVVSVGPDVHVQGGISRVIEMISARVPARVNFRHVPTFTRFTGAEGIDASQRGSRIGQGAVYLRALAAVMHAALARRAVFHVHFAGQRKFDSQGPFVWSASTLGCTYAVHSHAAETNLFHSWVPQLCRRMLLWGVAARTALSCLRSSGVTTIRRFLEFQLSRLFCFPIPRTCRKSFRTACTIAS